jgi:asparaginyl-tRNA synthetase
VELKATAVLHVGACEAATYPMAKKKQSMEFLREKAHLRWGGVGGGAGEWGAGV